MTASGFWLGTAGWSIPSAAADAFPASGTHLERYASEMLAAEINSSFHRPHRRTTYERWARSTPADFRFSIKIPKQISHVRRLVGAEEPLATFLEQAAGLGEKLGAILLQLPPSLAFDPAIARRFFETLRNRVGPALGLACEPRHATWFGTRAEECLTQYQIARVAADPVLAPDGERPGGWAGLRYHRLHGAPRTYYSAYDAKRLEALATAIAEDAETGRAVWCIFDNTASGAAINDALRLRSLLCRRDGSASGG